MRSVQRTELSGTQTMCLIWQRRKSAYVSTGHIWRIIVDDISDELLGEYGLIIHALCFPRSYYNANSGSSRLFKDIEREGIPC